MWLCKRDLSKECEWKYKDCTDCVLDKIRAKIETERNAGCHTQYAGGLDFALSIIDKYKIESEDKEVDL